LPGACSSGDTWDSAKWPRSPRSAGVALGRRPSAVTTERTRGFVAATASPGPRSRRPARRRQPALILATSQASTRTAAIDRVNARREERLPRRRANRPSARSRPPRQRPSAPGRVRGESRCRCGPLGRRRCCRRRGRCGTSCCGCNERGGHQGSQNPCHAPEYAYLDMLVPSSLGMGTGTLAAERPRRYVPSCQIDPTCIVASMRRRTLVKLVT